MLDHRPVDISDERFWLLGFALFVLVPIVATICWFGVPTGTAEITVDTSAVDGPVNVTVGDPVTLDDPNTEVETRQTLTGDGGVVFETWVPSEYVVAVRSPSGRCVIDLRLAREGEPPAWFTNRLAVDYVRGNCSAVGVDVGVKM